MVRKLQLDFTNVKEQSQFNKSRIPAGDYLAYVSKVEDAEVKASGEFQWLFTVKLRNKHATSSFPYYCQTSEKTLWKVRNLLVAAGINVPKKKFSVDPSKVLNRTIAVTIQDTEYENKPQSEIGSVFPAAELNGPGEDASTTTDDDDDDDATEQVDEESEVEEEEEESEEEVSADQFDAMDRAALKIFIRENDAEFKFLKSQSDDDLREKARSISVPLDEAEEEEEEEVEEEEEELPPPPKRVAKPAAKRPAARRAPKAPTDDEDLDIEDM